MNFREGFRRLGIFALAYLAIVIVGGVTFAAGLGHENPVRPWMSFVSWCVLLGFLSHAVIGFFTPKSNHKPPKTS